MNATTPIQIEAAELKTVLAGLSKVVSKRRSLPVLQSIRVSRDDQGTVTFQAADLECFLSGRLKESQPGEPLTLAMPLEALGRVAKTLKTSDRLGLLPGDCEKSAIIRSWAGGNPIDQKVDSPDGDFPCPPEVRQNSVLLDGSFKEALAQAMECVCTASHRPAITGVCIDTSKPNAHYLVGTNGSVLYSANSFYTNLDRPVIVPNRKFLLWPGFIDDGQWTLAVQPAKDDQEYDWIRFRSDHWTFTTRSIAEQFPDWRQVDPGPHKTRIELGAEAASQLESILPRLPGNNAPNYGMGLLVRGTQLLVFGREDERCEPAHVPVSGAEVSGEPVCLYLNRLHLQRALRFGQRTIDIVDAATPVVCSAPGRRLIIMPLRTDPQPSSTQNDQPETPSTGQTVTPTEERNTMATKTAPLQTAPTPPAQPAGANGSAVRAAIEQVEGFRNGLRQLMGQSNELLSRLKAVEREHKASEKEIQSVRATLRNLQRVQI